MPTLETVDRRGCHDDWRQALARPDVSSDADVARAVREILDAVRRGGDAAVRDLTERFDGCRPDPLEVPAAAIDAALDRIPSRLRAALELAADQIRAYHETQRPSSSKHERRGVHIRELVVPVDRVGCYVPGGRAVYPSTVLMTAVPARVAGVPEVVLCVPPSADGSVPDITLAAARIAGVDRVFAVGGAQAVGALAFGTDAIPAVDVIVGPGNAYVTEAKRQVVGVVGIDSLAGPSEVVIVGDASTDPALVAADMLAQAEHGPGGRAVLVTWEESLGAAVSAALDDQLAATARRTEAAATLATGGRLVLVDGPDTAIEAVNALAPEHVQLMCGQADDLVEGIRHAGAVFCGPWASAVVGDYVAGVNHVLPTGTSARFSSALRVDTFLKHIHVVTLDREALVGLAPAVEALTDAEGLTAHGDAVRLRLSEEAP